MLQYELPDIEQPGQVLQSSVILDGFHHLGKRVIESVKLSIASPVASKHVHFSFLTKRF